MEPLMFIMAILGCGESDAPCREVAVAEASYSSEGECLAATEEELVRRSDLVFPSVVAQCRPAGARPALAGAPYFTDASALVPGFGGAPTIVIGPGQAEQCHKTDEHCALSDIHDAVALYRDLIERLCVTAG